MIISDTSNTRSRYLYFVRLINSLSAENEVFFCQCQNEVFFWQIICAIIWPHAGTRYRRDKGFVPFVTHKHICSYACWNTRHPSHPSYLRCTESTSLQVTEELLIVIYDPHNHSWMQNFQDSLYIFELFPCWMMKRSIHHARKKHIMWNFTGPEVASLGFSFASYYCADFWQWWQVSFFQKVSASYYCADFWQWEQLIFPKSLRSKNKDEMKFD